MDTAVLLMLPLAYLEIKNIRVLKRELQLSGCRSSSSVVSDGPSALFETMILSNTIFPKMVRVILGKCHHIDQVAFIHLLNGAKPSVFSTDIKAPLAFEW